MTQRLRIGIVDYHGDLRRVITDIIPAWHEVVVVPAAASQVDVDLLINHHDDTRNRRFDVPFLALPYGTVLQHHVEGWNGNPNCVGVLDVSGDILRRFYCVIPPVLPFRPFYPDTPVYEHAGTKVISLILRYKERYPESFALACSLTPYVYGNPYVNDLEVLKDAKWLLHLKPSGGFVCNAVIKALACGVPVIMDDETWEDGYFTNWVRHNHNGLVVPADKLRDLLRDFPGEQYDRIKGNCVAEAGRFKRGFKWTDGWWMR